MYSGFYQHEIKNNLMDAEKLFIAMGYKLLPNQTLVLDGPICPDQVTNVSRDALTAFVECQIMKQVNAELSLMGLATSWQDIFNFRECHVGDSSQSIKGLAQIIQARHNHMLRKGNFHHSLVHSTAPFLHARFYFDLIFCSSVMFFRSICLCYTRTAFATSFIITFSAAAPPASTNVQFAL